MLVMTLNHYADRANLITGSLILWPGNQQVGRYLRMSAPKVFWLLLYVASVTATARADPLKPQDGDLCTGKTGQVITYTQRVEVFRGGSKQIESITVTCTCKYSGTSDENGAIYYWQCEW
jgi:hypothetical protein